MNCLAFSTTFFSPLPLYRESYRPFTPLPIPCSSLPFPSTLSFSPPSSPSLSDRGSHAATFVDCFCSHLSHCAKGVRAAALLCHSTPPHASAPRLRELVL